jgi:hypothetical protein
VIELPTEGTIKRKLLDDMVQNVGILPDELAKRHGLNGHDLAKNLEQLRKEGFIRTVWGAGEKITKAVPLPSIVQMIALNGHLRHPTNGHIDYTPRVAEAINALPWNDRGWREWDKRRVVELSGLNGDQVGHALKILREAGRLQQLGGGGVGKPIQGVRWRGEQPPAQPEQVAHVESVPEPVEAPSGPSGDVAPVEKGSFPQSRKALSRWKKMLQAAELLKETGNEDLAEKLGETEEWIVMALLGYELEELLRRVDAG